MIMNTTVKSILNGWKNSIEKYNKLDTWKIGEQLSILGRYLRNNDDSKDIVRQVRFIRDCVISPNLNVNQLLYMINKVVAMAEASMKSVCLFRKKND